MGMTDERAAHLIREMDLSPDAEAGDWWADERYGGLTNAELRALLDDRESAEQRLFDMKSTLAALRTQAQVALTLIDSITPAPGEGRDGAKGGGG